MNKGGKSYLVFTSWGYRIWGLLVIPALLLAVTYFIFADIAAISSHGLYTGGSLVLFYEIFSDYWLFGGICSRQPEYLKTSLQGMPVLRGALIGDLIRRFLYVMVFAAVCYGKNESCLQSCGHDTDRGHPPHHLYGNRYRTCRGIRRSLVYGRNC